MDTVSGAPLLSVITFGPLVGALLILLFAVYAGWLPAGGIAADGSSVSEQLRYLLLPAITLTMTSIGSHARLPNSR